MAEGDHNSRLSNVNGETRSTRDPAVFDTIAHFLRTELFPGGDRFSQHVLLTLYRRLAEGSPVALADLSAASGADLRAVYRVLEEVAPSRLRYDDSGRIVAFAGLTQRPAKHRFVVNRRELFTWCAFDALFLPQLLGVTARISSACPITETAITLAVSKDGIDAGEPTAAVMSFVMPDGDSCRADLRGSFCNHVNFLASWRVADVWLARNPAAAILSLNDAFRLARIRNDAAFGHVLTARQTAP